jgi:hypothetical protein
MLKWTEIQRKPRVFMDRVQSQLDLYLRKSKNHSHYFLQQMQYFASNIMFPYPNLILKFKILICKQEAHILSLQPALHKIVHRMPKIFQLEWEILKP